MNFTVDVVDEKILWDKVLRYLSYRPRSKHEIDSYLNRIKADKKSARLIIDKLFHYNYINDAEFCNWWVKARTSSGKGRHCVYRELLQKGVEKDMVKFAIEENSEDENNALVRLIEKLSRKYPAKQSHLAKNNLLRVLVQRGFDYYAARSAVEKRLNKE